MLANHTGESGRVVIFAVGDLVPFVGVGERFYNLRVNSRIVIAGETPQWGS